VSRVDRARICKAIDDNVAVLRQRRLDHQPFVYVWLDATYVHVRERGQVISKAVVIATGCRADGYREVLGVDVGDSENETFWTEFLRDLVDRGLHGVRLVISDAHAGLRAAIRRVLQGAGWQRCRVHAKRNLLAVARHSQRQVISALRRDEHGRRGGAGRRRGPRGRHLDRRPDQQAGGPDRRLADHRCRDLCRQRHRRGVGDRTGELFIRQVAAYRVSALMEYARLRVERAAQASLDEVAELGGLDSGGLIALDRRGNLAMPFNTSGMYRGYATRDGRIVVHIFGDE
jgi:hypothetical protein